jgi:hypothetical protein
MVTQAFRSRSFARAALVVPARPVATRSAALEMLAGAGEGEFWMPVRGAFPDDDLLLTPDGKFLTHLHQRPSSMGTFQLEGTTLTLHGWMGDGDWVVTSMYVHGATLEGVAEGKPLVMRRSSSLGHR